ncbi:MAG: RnfABCDGE type electron transport complex subunit G [Bacteroidota bacterium]|nr:RnfABCDGE type electron transport complex subunit G [Bacteroidota bacterium]
MAKLESSLTNMVISLSLISAIMAAALGVTYLLTKDTIANVERKNINTAIQQVVPAFDNDPFADQFKVNNGTDTFVCYPAKKASQVVGYAVKTFTNKGFGGHISIMVGFLPDGTIYNTSVLEHKETPGLGTKMTDPKFKNQFKGKNPNSYNLSVKKDGGDVDAITAATISSRAFCDALGNAFKAVHKKVLSSNNAAVTDSSAIQKGGLK